MDSTILVLQRVSDSLQIALLDRAVDISHGNAAWIGVFVGAMGVLVAVGAIFFAVLQYRQSADFRRVFEKQISEHKLTFEHLIGERIAAANVELEALRQARTDIRDDALRAKGAERNRLEELARQFDSKVNALESRLQSLSPQLPSFPDWSLLRPKPDQFTAFSLKRTCPHCGREYELPSLRIGPDSSGAMRSVCPHCSKPLPSLLFG